MTRSALTTLLVLMTAGCGSTSSSSSTHATARAVQVAIKNFAFAPSVVHARAGQTIVWTNYDAAPHNVTYVSGPRFSSSAARMDTGATFSLKLTGAGAIRYY